MLNTIKYIESTVDDVPFLIPYIFINVKNRVHIINAHFVTSLFYSNRWWDVLETSAGTVVVPAPGHFLYSPVDQGRPTNG